MSRPVEPWWWKIVPVCVDRWLGLTSASGMVRLPDLKDSQLEIMQCEDSPEYRATLTKFMDEEDAFGHREIGVGPTPAAALHALRTKLEARDEKRG